MTGFISKRFLPICTGFYGTEIKIQYNTIVSSSEISKPHFMFLTRALHFMTLTVAKIIQCQCKMNEWVWSIGRIILTEISKHSEKNLDQCHSVHHNPIDWPTSDPRSLW